MARRRSGSEVFGELETYLASSVRARVSLEVLEREAERRGREAVRCALQAHLDCRAGRDFGPALELKSDEATLRLSHKRLHTRRLISIAGEVSVTRYGYGARGQACIHPMDAELRLPARTYSYEFGRRLVRFVICGPFDEAIATMEEMTGVAIPKRSAEQIVIEAAEDFANFYATRAQAPAMPRDGEILVGAIDCKGIPMVKPDGARRVVRRRKGEKANKKKMATVAAVFSQPPRRRSPQQVLDSLFASAESVPPRRERRDRPTKRRVWASLTSSKDAFIADVRAEMCRRDPHHQHTWVMVTDGERALQRRVAASFAGVTLVLDLLHVTEKLWRAAHALHKEGSPEAQAFVYERAERILNGQVSQVVKGLRQMVTKRRLTGTKAETLRSVAAYFYANRERMRYDLYLAKGWPIASGSVEGACKNLVRDRFERSGMRWSPPMAEALLQLRATYLSGDLDEYWAAHIEADQQRLYRNVDWRVARR